MMTYAEMVGKKLASIIFDNMEHNKVNGVGLRKVVDELGMVEPELRQSVIDVLEEELEKAGCSF